MVVIHIVHDIRKLIISKQTVIYRIVSVKRDLVYTS